MRVLIVGCGYVGLQLGTDLVRAGHEVFGLARQATARPELAAAGITPVNADITRPHELDALPRNFDWVANCVASSGGTAEEYRQVYFRGTLNLIDWLAPTELKAFVFTSSTSVYGQTDGSWVDEESPTVPPSETGNVLLETEAVLQNAVRAGTFPAAILRVAAIYGPGRGYWFKQFLAGEARIEGSGDRILNMIHRDDVAGAAIAALHKGIPGEVYNAVDDHPVAQREFFQWLARELHRPEPPTVSEEFSPARKRGSTHKRVANQKLKLRLGYRFQFPSFREGYAAEIAALKPPGARESGASSL